MSNQNTQTLKVLKLDIPQYYNEIWLQLYINITLKTITYNNIINRPLYESLSSHTYLQAALKQLYFQTYSENQPLPHPKKTARNRFKVNNLHGTKVLRDCSQTLFDLGGVPGAKREPWTG